MTNIELKHYSVSVVLTDADIARMAAWETSLAHLLKRKYRQMVAGQRRMFREALGNVTRPSKKIHRRNGRMRYH